ncbi:MAG: signal peptidase [Pirellulaceae bacterium]|nr:signal peptidase [Pirellulaceae bacterium]
MAKKYIARFGSMRMVGVFSAKGKNLCHRGDKVVVQTDRGMEVGEILTEATERSLSFLESPVSGTIMRETTESDFSQADHQRSRLRDDLTTCEEYIKRLQLNMTLVDIEHILGGERVVIYYLAEQRVDFRELVKLLASEFQTRIEMRQIGVRDEAKLLADYGDCGQPVCCGTHLAQMPPVSMRMAKLQKATLDPTKISGRCGRLKCCLRYEYETYDELQRELPPIGSEILTRDGKMLIINQEVMNAQLIVLTEDKRRKMIPSSDVISIIHVGTGELQHPYGNPRQGSNDNSKSPSGGRPPSKGHSSTHSPRSQKERPKRDKSAKPDLPPKGGNKDRKPNKDERP